MISAGKSSSESTSGSVSESSLEVRIVHARLCLDDGEGLDICDDQGTDGQGMSRNQSSSDQLRCPWERRCRMRNLELTKRDGMGTWERNQKPPPPPPPPPPKRRVEGSHFSRPHITKVDNLIESWTGLALGGSERKLPRNLAASATAEWTFAHAPDA
jgi:hypothetical protein